MPPTHYYSIPYLKQQLNRLNLSLKKRWGQNFLIDKNIAHKIIRAAQIPPHALIWEVGPGFGALTNILLEMSANIALLEIDFGIIEYIQSEWQQFQERSNEQKKQSHITYPAIVAGDAVKTIPQLLAKTQSPDILIGNLPYRSAAAILAQTVKPHRNPHTIALLVQKEIASRISAAPCNKNYSSFSVLMQAKYTVRNRFAVSRQAFYPIPNVDSHCMILERRVDAQTTPMHTLEMLLRTCFSARRATMRNNILRSQTIPKPIVDRIVAQGHMENIDIQRRAETVSPQEFHRMALWLHQALETSA